MSFELSVLGNISTAFFALSVDENISTGFCLFFENQGMKEHIDYLIIMILTNTLLQHLNGLLLVKGIRIPIGFYNRQQYILILFY